LGLSVLLPQVLSPILKVGVYSLLLGFLLVIGVGCLVDSVSFEWPSEQRIDQG
jgi:hypothetical protein